MLDAFGLAGSSPVNSEEDYADVVQADVEEAAATQNLTTFKTAVTSSPRTDWLVFGNPADNLITGIVPPELVVDGGWELKSSASSASPTDIHIGKIPYLAMQDISNTYIYTRPTAGFGTSIDTATLQASQDTKIISDLFGNSTSYYTGVPSHYNTTVDANDRQPIVALLTEAEIIATTASDWVSSYD